MFMGIVDIAAGEPVLGVKVTGKRGISKGYVIGLEYLKLIPVK